MPAGIDADSRVYCTQSVVVPLFILTQTVSLVLTPVGTGVTVCAQKANEPGSGARTAAGKDAFSHLF